MKVKPEDMEVVPPSVDKVPLRGSRISLSSLPPEVQRICTDNKFERLLHSRGRDFIDIIQNIHGKVENPCDLVAFPRSEHDISVLLTYCSNPGSHKPICVVPFGGGSSVVQGVEPPGQDLDSIYSGCISMDMKFFDKILEVDEVSMCARIQAGVYGPALENYLRPKGLTLRYFPQSFEFSTFGGWVATRGGGHFATGPTHIDDLIESVRLVSPLGVSETRRLPGSGAGPSEVRHYIGSEGMYGAIVEGWARLRRRPQHRTSATIEFPGSSAEESFLCGARAVRRICQSGLQPANLRLVHGVEFTRMTHRRASDVECAVLIIGFESAETEGESILKEELQMALQLLNAEPKIEINVLEHSGGAKKAEKSSEHGGAAGSWGKGFMKGGYSFSDACVRGLVLNTFETAVTWDRFETFHRSVLKAVEDAIEQHCPGGGQITCRFTHIYPDGPAPYYTILANGILEPEDKRVEQWLAIKKAGMDAVMQNGGTSTHHHAVGRLHVEYLQKEHGALFGDTLKAIKKAHDPAWIMNPEVVIPVPPLARL
eukprot:gnl/MRDRNA2_/MRDRNA2_151852_c0_seq1.p1 gnl/MRDRNA2_/MRDRNA2_151852_c0~~gnl/MRDRNA2_/MRDRNA2_151852_c0_seq1.p1  ORF type:complete len:549 (+),score=87.30 gnl/MRDRNA2_/MRDRNA2_151852_c0_seq1:25-1647(+)